MVYTDGPGPLAQWSELAAHTRSVAGSSPAGPTILGAMRQCSRPVGPGCGAWRPGLRE
jgi:hypothetical protein